MLVKRNQAMQTLAHWDRQGRFVYTLADLRKLFSEDGVTLQATLRRLKGEGTLDQVTRGVYLYTFAHSQDGFIIEHIAKAMRRGHYSYISLESALSEYGAISQIPIDRLTVMTTGRSGEYKTSFGTIEFTHTKRDAAQILQGVCDQSRPLRFAKPATAWRDLKRVGRNVHLVSLEALEGA